MFGRYSAKLEAQEPVNADINFAKAWGYTLEGWNALSWQDRADYRDRVVYAPFFEGEKVNA